MARNRGRAAAAKPEVIEAPDEADDGLTPVRTTFNPHEVIRVGAAELLDLERQGLIYSGDDPELDEPDDDEGTAVPSGVITDPPAGDPATDDEDESEGQE